MSEDIQDTGYTVDGNGGYVPVFEAGKRLGLMFSGFDEYVHDWFVGWSPRNSSSYAEGPWDHWVDFALKILSDPMTKVVRPDVYRPEAAADVVGFYSEAGRLLTEEELHERFD